jgi:hypothetical protein
VVYLSWRDYTQINISPSEDVTVTVANIEVEIRTRQQSQIQHLIMVENQLDVFFARSKEKIPPTFIAKTTAPNSYGLHLTMPAPPPYGIVIIDPAFSGFSAYLG